MLIINDPAAVEWLEAESEQVIAARHSATRLRQLDVLTTAETKELRAAYRVISLAFGDPDGMIRRRMFEIFDDFHPGDSAARWPEPMPGSTLMTAGCESRDCPLCTDPV